MKHVDSAAVCAVFMGLCLHALSAQQGIANILSLQDEELAALRNGSVISADNAGESEITRLAPDGSAVYRKLAAAPSGGSGFAVASVSVVPYPASWASMNAGARMTALYNILGRVSTQKGITYISRRAGYKPKELFSQSYYIRSPREAGVPLADPSAESVPASESRYVFQEDTSFGGNVYEYMFRNTSSELFLEVTNITPMKYHGITCLKEKELSMYISVYPASDGIIVNSAAIVTGHRTHVKILFLDVDLSDSFKRRTDALHEWFKAETGK